MEIEYNLARRLEQSIFTHFCRSNILKSSLDNDKLAIWATATGYKQLETIILMDQAIKKTL